MSVCQSTHYGKQEPYEDFRRDAIFRQWKEYTVRHACFSCLFFATYKDMGSVFDPEATNVKDKLKSINSPWKRYTMFGNRISIR